MAHVVGVAVSSHPEVKDYEKDEAAENGSALARVDVQIAEFHADEKRARQTENRSGSTHRKPVRTVRKADKTAAYSGQQVKHECGKASKEFFRKPSQAEEAPHVQGDMDKVPVYKCGCQQPPVLPAQ